MNNIDQSKRLKKYRENNSNVQNVQINNNINLFVTNQIYKSNDNKNE
jgi:hypothetical protein